MRKEGIVKILVVLMVICGFLVIVEKILLWTGSKSLLYYIGFFFGYVVESVSRLFSS